MKDTTFEEQALKTAKPSDFMKIRRPDEFSDSGNRAVQFISKDVFEYKLATITERSQEKEFEFFCRHLAEKELCPNLIYQTGPTGGGDSKVDTETYPVADKISLKWFEGIGREANQERWAFAISAKAQWRPKIKSDVAGIVSTNRAYKLIYFMTNQSVSDRKRAEVEDSLKNEFDIEVRILDKTWLVNKVYDNERFDLAASSLGLDINKSEFKLSRNDSIKTDDLQALEKEIDDFDETNSSYFELIENCLYSAILSRELEKPKFEVIGRFERAIHIARERKLSNCLNKVLYQYAWTSYWWHDDANKLSSLYDELEKSVIDSNSVWELEKLATLWITLQTALIHSHLNKEQAKLKIRYSNLTAKLQLIADDKSRPNASLTAITELSFLGMSKSMMLKEPLDSWFEKLIYVLNNSELMMDVPVNKIIRYVDELCDLLDEHPMFDELFDVATEISSNRVSNSQKGCMLIKNAFRNMRLDKNFKALIQLGEASRLLAQKESRDDFILAQIGIGQAYENIGLNWSARNGYITALYKLINDFDETSQLPPITIRVLNKIIWTEVKSGRVPVVFFWMQLKSFLIDKLCTPNNNSAEEEEAQLLDAILGIMILKSSYKDLSKLEALPSFIDECGLAVSWVAALYILGYEDVIKAEIKDIGNLEELCIGWINQPANSDLPNITQWGMGDICEIKTSVIGVDLKVAYANQYTATLFAESLVTVIESIFATALNHNIFPHVSEFLCQIKVDDTLEEVVYRQNENDVGEISLTIFLPNLNIIKLIPTSSYQETLIKIAGEVFSLIVVDIDERQLKELMVNDLAIERMNQAIHLPTLIDNVALSNYKASWNDWSHNNLGKFALRRNKTWRSDIFHSNTIFDSPDKLQDFKVTKHNDTRVLTIINQRLWDKAKWAGTGFISTIEESNEPPVIALMFEDQDSATKIFKGWLKKFGCEDVNNMLCITLIKGIFKSSPNHYALQVAPNFEQLSLSGKKSSFMMISRSKVMTPETSENLDRFIGSFTRAHQFMLAPAIFNEHNNTSSFSPPELWIKKSDIRIVDAWEIDENDMALMAMPMDADPIIPEHVDNAPILEALKKRNKK